MVLQRSAVLRKPGTGGTAIQCVKTLLVSEKRSQSLKDPGKTTATIYPWTSSFVIYLYGVDPGEERNVRVIVYLQTDVSDSIFNNWADQVKTKWSGEFAIKDGDENRYPISVELARASSTYKDYTITAVGSDTALGVRGYFGTESMTKWGVNDPQDIPHEVGHMLGNKDEYGTVDGVDYGDANNQLLDESSKSVMRRGDQPVRMRHFELIREKLAASKHLPDPVALIKVTKGVSMASAMGLSLSSSSSKPVAKPIAVPVKASVPVSTPTTVSTPVAKPVAKPLAVPAKASASPATTSTASTPLSSAKPASSPGPKAAAKPAPLGVAVDAGHLLRQKKIYAYMEQKAQANTLGKKEDDLVARFPDWWNNPTHSLGMLTGLGI